MQDEAALFKLLGDPTRLRLATLLAIRGETCVCYLAEALEEPDYKISRHLGIMRSAGMVEARREGTWVYYKLNKPAQPLEHFLQKCFCECLANYKNVKTDLERLSKAIIQGERCVNGESDHNCDT